MPRLSIWMIRTALVYLALGFTFGGLLLAHKGLNWNPLFWALLPLHIESLLLGWMVQLALGVAYWILPRFSQEPRRPRSWLAWLSFGLLNAGILLAGLGPLLTSAAGLVWLGRGLEAAAALAFAVHAWPRVKASGVG